MRRTFVALVLVLASGAWPAAVQPSQATLDVSVDPSGRYEVRLHSPGWSFGGDVGRPITNIAEADGQDALGGFHQVDFDHATQSSEIRVYHDLPAVLFTTTYPACRDQVLAALPHLTEEQVEAALAYYRDHVAEIDAEIDRHRVALREFLQAS